MMGLGEKCLNCKTMMRIEERIKPSDDKQVALLRCFGCGAYWRVDLTLSSVRSYKYKEKKYKKRPRNEKPIRPKFPFLPIYSDEYMVADGLYGLGEKCPKCESDMRIRTSRRVSESFKIIYLRCTNRKCGTGQKVELSVSPFYEE
ncbi:ogr/Delta-like zinc finger family protein [Vreelandella venusta]